MHPALNMANMTKEGFSHMTIEETKYLFKTPCIEDRAKKMQGVEFPAHKKVMAAIDRHPAMICQNHMAGCLPCQNETVKNLQMMLQMHRIRCTSIRQVQTANSSADATAAPHITLFNQ
jgi:hypothetical protein